MTRRIGQRIGGQLDSSLRTSGAAPASSPPIVGRDAHRVRHQQQGLLGRRHRRIRPKPATSAGRDRTDVQVPNPAHVLSAVKAQKMDG